MRTRPPERLTDLLAAATAVFREYGYQRAQMADVARAMGVAKGTLYLYVESKAALFDLVVRQGLGLLGDQEVPALPVPTPEPGATLALLKPRIADRHVLPELEDALAGPPPTDVVAEFAGIIRALFRLMADNRDGIVVLEKSAYDWPELWDLFFERMRMRLLADMTTYIERRMAEGEMRALPQPRLAALEIMQTLTWFCLYRRSEMDWPEIDEETICEALVDSLSHAFLTCPPRSGSPPGDR